MNPNLKEIIIDWLQKNGYGGLYNDNNNCKCEIADLILCEWPNFECRAGYRKESDKYDFIITPTK